MNTYRTVDLARMFGIHVNTVRLYERYGLIPKAERTQSGYRIFTELHVEQFKLARAALRVEVLQNGLRKQAVTIVKTSASGDFETALKLTKRYSDQVDQEIKHGEEAVRICRRMLAGIKEPCSGKDREQTMYTRKEAAGILGVTIDTLRNWELNGLFSVRRMANGYRVYTGEDIQRLTIIRSLRCANYSLSSIPSIRTSPESALLVPSIHSTAVLFPAPLAPSSPYIWPGRIVRFRLSITFFPE